MLSNMLTGNNSRSSCNGTYASSALTMSIISATAMRNILREDDDADEAEGGAEDEDEDENGIEDDATVLI